MKFKIGSYYFIAEHPIFNDGYIIIKITNCDKENHIYDYKPITKNAKIEARFEHFHENSNMSKWNWQEIDKKHMKAIKILYETNKKK